LIQFHFGLKTKFIFNQGITPWNWKILLLYNPQRGCSLLNLEIHGYFWYHQRNFIIFQQKQIIYFFKWRQQDKKYIITKGI
jgi:hypothetical protein